MPALTGISFKSFISLSEDELPIDLLLFPLLPFQNVAALLWRNPSLWQNESFLCLVSARSKRIHFWCRFPVRTNLSFLQRVLACILQIFENFQSGLLLIFSSGILPSLNLHSGNRFTGAHLDLKSAFSQHSYDSKTVIGLFSCKSLLPVGGLVHLPFLLCLSNASSVQTNLRKIGFSTRKY